MSVSLILSALSLLFQVIKNAPAWLTGKPRLVIKNCIIDSKWAQIVSKEEKQAYIHSEAYFEGVVSAGSKNCSVTKVGLVLSEYGLVGFNEKSTKLSFNVLANQTATFVMYGECGWFVDKSKSYAEQNSIPAQIAVEFNNENVKTIKINFPIGKLFIDKPPFAQ